MKILRLTESMNQIVTENKKLQSDIVIVNNVKDAPREKARSNKTLTLTKSKNIGIWVVSTSNQLF